MQRTDGETTKMTDRSQQVRELIQLAEKHGFVLPKDNR
jgi:hypothetical protein